jgi:hypothetical protein
LFGAVPRQAAQRLLTVPEGHALHRQFQAPGLADCSGPHKSGAAAHLN